MYSMKRKTVHDDARIDYIKQHLNVIADAIADVPMLRILLMVSNGCIFMVKWL